MRHKSVTRNGCSKLGDRRLVDSRHFGHSNPCFLHSDFNCSCQHGLSKSDERNRRQKNEEATLSQNSQSLEILPVPSADLTVPVEVSIMNDLKRMRDCEISNKKARRLRFKTLPSTIFRAFRGFVRGNKAMQEEKSNQENLSVVCFDEIFQIPFNLVPTTKATEDKSNMIICPGLNEAITFPFYFGNIDRHEAANILEGLDHGYFLLRDSFHPEFRFAVSFRVQGIQAQTVHARICYNNGRYTFKMDDSMRFSSRNLLDFLNHYNYVGRCVMDEPYLLKPVNRKQPFLLQFLCIATIASRCTPKGVESLPIPEALKSHIITTFLVV